MKGDKAEEDADLKYLEAIGHRIIKRVLLHVAQSQCDPLGLRSTYKKKWKMLIQKMLGQKASVHGSTFFKNKHIAPMGFMVYY